MTSEICVSEVISSADNSNCYPLYIFADEEDLALSEAGNNFTPEFLELVAKKLKLKQDRASGLPEGINAEELFYYIYAIFYSPTYRKRFAEHLRIDFPRVPLTGKEALFKTLAKFGSALVELHLLRSKFKGKNQPSFVGGEAQIVMKPTWAAGKIRINEASEAGFEGIDEDVWNFQVGSYRVCEKWLKDRKGRSITKSDAEKFSALATSIAGTIGLMGDIDKLINSHGGWPKAFQ